MDVRVPSWVLTGVPDDQVGDTVLCVPRSARWDTQRFLSDPDVTHGQRGVYVLSEFEGLRRAGGLGHALLHAEPVLVVVLLAVAPDFGLQRYAGLVESAVRVLFPLGLPESAEEEDAAWARFPLGDDGLPAVDHLMAESDGQARHGEVERAIVRHVRTHSSDFFREPDDVEQDVVLRLTYAFEVMADRPDRIGRARGRLLVESASAVSRQAGSRRLQARTQEWLDRFDELAERAEEVGATRQVPCAFPMPYTRKQRSRAR